MNKSAGENTRQRAHEAGSEINVDLIAALEPGGHEALPQLLVFGKAETAAEGARQGKDLVPGHFFAANRALIRPLAGDDVENAAGLFGGPQEKRRGEQRDHAEDREGKRNVEKDDHVRHAYTSMELIIRLMKNAPSEMRPTHTQRSLWPRSVWKRGFE